MFEVVLQVMVIVVFVIKIEKDDNSGERQSRIFGKNGFLKKIKSTLFILPEIFWCLGKGEKRFQNDLAI